MTAPNSTPNTGRDTTGLLGLREFSAALELWQTHPGRETHGALV